MNEMGLKKLIKAALILLLCSTSLLTKAQETQEQIPTQLKDPVRGKNVLTIAGGTSIMNGDFVDPLWEIYFHGGYKRFLGSHVNINFTYHKFNLAYEDVFNQGYMSFDLNLEVYLLPFDEFSPYVFAGAGLNAANYFDSTDMKVQGGVGIEYLATQRIGIKLFADYNNVFSDTLDGLEAGDSDDVYWRMGLGLNFYFGKQLQSKVSARIPTVIKSNPLVDDY